MAITKISQLIGAGSTIPTAGRFAQISSGGTITTYTSGGITYEVRTFTASGTLTVGSSGVVDLLVLGGGGGGGNCDTSGQRGGGGGAGEFMSLSNYFLQAGSYTITVGAGGAGNSFGNNTSLGTEIVAARGGAGGAGGSDAGGAGASGGGGGRSTTAAQSGGLSAFDAAGSGKNGGNGGFNVTNGASSGGGGGGSTTAGGIGSSSSGTAGGAGGSGSSSSITGSTVGYCGGGGGATGGTATDGGGAGAATAAGNGTSGDANRGGGGGGAAGTGPSGGSGGSGVVIVRTIIAGTAAGVAASGGTETTYTGDGTNGVNGQAYRVHTFTSGTQTLTVSGGGFVDLLAVGGGASGASGLGEGGDAGQIVNRSNYYLAPGTYSVTIGSGGASPGGGDLKGLRGNATSFGDLVCQGGRGGRPVDGGAGFGPSVSSNITGSSVTYAVGGPTSVSSGTGAAGTANRGNGGQGGGSGGGAGGAGGSGIVIVRYPI